MKKMMIVMTMVVGLLMGGCAHDKAMIVKVDMNGPIVNFDSLKSDAGSLSLID